MKFLAKLICCFIPIKKWRKAVRKALYEDKRHENKTLAMLRRCGNYEIKEIDGIKSACGNSIQIGNIFEGDAIVVVEEVFGNGEYHFETSSDCIVIDIGMNVGLASLYFSTIEQVKHVYSFEPFKPTFDQALFNLKINPQLGSKIYPFNYGLGDKNKELTFEYYPDAPGQMSTVKKISETHPWRKNKTLSETVTIRDAATEIRTIIEKYPGFKVVLKCDTEGSEKEIFERLDEEHLIPSIDIIMLEFHFSYDKPILNILKRNGFIFFRQKTVTLDTGDFGMIRAVNEKA